MTSFSEMIENDLSELLEDNILVVDAFNLAFRWKHMKKLDFEYDYIRTVESLAKSYECSKVIITADKGSSKYRKSILPEYKAHRKEAYADQTEREKAEFEQFIAEYETTLKSLSLKYPVLRYSGVEADDIAAYIVKQYRDQYNIWLVSSDRDWDLLIHENVSRFSYVTRKETTIYNWEEHYSVPMDEYISYKCLTGDKGDNVPGIPGVGPVKAKELLDTYGTAFDVYSACPIESKYKYIQSLNENSEQLLINYQLMDLETYCEDAIGIENIEDIDNSISEYLNESRL